MVVNYPRTVGKNSYAEHNVGRKTYNKTSNLNFRITVAANNGWYQIAKELTKEDGEKISKTWLISLTLETPIRSKTTVPYFPNPATAT